MIKENIDIILLALGLLCIALSIITLVWSNQMSRKSTLDVPDARHRESGLRSLSVGYMMGGVVLMLIGTIYHDGGEQPTEPVQEIEQSSSLNH